MGTLDTLVVGSVEAQEEMYCSYVSDIPRINRFRSEEDEQETGFSRSPDYSRVRESFSTAPEETSKERGLQRKKPVQSRRQRRSGSPLLIVKAAEPGRQCTQRRGMVDQFISVEAEVPLSRQ